MILTRTPLRISFAGGGSDLPQFFETQPGAVLAAAINQYMYLAVNDKFDGGVRVSYSRTENVADADALEHDLARETLKHFDIAHGIEIVSVADVPSGTGLGSSSAYAVGLYAALQERAQRGALVRALLARSAAEIEMHHCGRNVGLQDHYTAAHGGVRLYQFSSEGVEAGPQLDDTLTLPLRSHLLLFYAGGTHDAHALLTAQSADAGWVERTQRLAQYAKDMCAALQLKRFDAFGEMLHETWLIKRAYASNPEIDELYRRALHAGAWGGKLCGAGGAGFLLVCAPPERHPQICRTLGLPVLDFAFENRGVEVWHV